MLKFAQRLRKMRKEESGFTLIELMVVVVIIGILAAVAVPKITGIVWSSKVNADVASGKTIQDALDRYEQNNNQAPANLTALTQPDPSGNTYLNSVPVSQQTKQPAGTGVIVYSGAGTTSGTITVYDNNQSDSSTPTGKKQVWP